MLEQLAPSCKLERGGICSGKALGFEAPGTLTGPAVGAGDVQLPGSRTNGGVGTLKICAELPLRHENLSNGETVPIWVSFQRVLLLRKALSSSFLQIG